MKLNVYYAHYKPDDASKKSRIRKFTKPQHRHTVYECYYFSLVHFATVILFIKTPMNET